MKTFKIKSLKAISAIVAAAIGITSFQTAQAAQFNTQGRVAGINATDLNTQGANTNSVYLHGVSSLGNCATFFGVVLFRLKDDLHGQQMFAIALAAAASGSTLSITVEDTNRDPGGFCYVQNFTMIGN